MGCNRWDAQAFHKRFQRTRTHNGFRSLVGAVLLGIMLVAGGAVALVGTVGTGADSERVGVCHATGDAENPSVFVVVDRDGADHGHHAAHADDVIGATSEADCPASEATSQAEGPAVAVCHTGDAQTDAYQEEGYAVDEAAPAAADAQEATPASCPGDVALTATPTVDPGQVHVEYVTQSVGPLRAYEARLVADLPDLGGIWTLTGADAEDCVLTHLRLECAWGDLSAGETRSVAAASPRCPLDCGDAIQAPASVSAANDVDPSNDEDVFSVDLVACEPAADTPEPGVDDPAAEEPPQGNETDDAQTPVPDEENASAAEDPNATVGEENGTVGDENATVEDENATVEEPAPARPDVAVQATTDQDTEQVVLTLVVTNVGDDPVQNVRLDDALPDVRRPWFLGGPDGARCILDAGQLSCWLGALEPGATRTVVLKAFTDRMPCGQHLVHTAQVLADQDVDASNDRSSASIEARAC